MDYLFSITSQSLFVRLRWVAHILTHQPEQAQTHCKLPDYTALFKIPCCSLKSKFTIQACVKLASTAIMTYSREVPIQNGTTPSNNLPLLTGSCIT